MNPHYFIITYTLPQHSTRMMLGSLCIGILKSTPLLLLFSPVLLKIIIDAAPGLVLLSLLVYL